MCEKCKQVVCFCEYDAEVQRLAKEQRKIIRDQYISKISRKSSDCEEKTEFFQHLDNFYTDIIDGKEEFKLTEDF